MEVGGEDVILQTRHHRLEDGVILSIEGGRGRGLLPWLPQAPAGVASVLHRLALDADETAAGGDGRLPRISIPPPQLRNGEMGSGLTWSRVFGIAGGAEPAERERDADPEDEEVDAILRGI
jgi:hypothetical protein